jgi:DNA-directed RNA polymerase II subunit RPB1
MLCAIGVICNNGPVVQMYTIAHPAPVNIVHVYSPTSPTFYRTTPAYQSRISSTYTRSASGAKNAAIASRTAGPSRTYAAPSYSRPSASSASSASARSNASRSYSAPSYSRPSASTASRSYSAPSYSRPSFSRRP